MKWIKQLLGLCDHKWKTVAAYNVNYDYVNYTTTDPKTVAHDYHQQCEKCGKIRKVRL